MPPSTTNLTVSYQPPNKDSSDAQYASILFPEGYNDAVVTALNILGKYMTTLNPQPADVVLKHRTKNADRQRIWTEFDPANWGLIVSAGDEVRLFEKGKPGSEKSVPIARDNIFRNGPIYLVFGSTDSSCTTWTTLERDDTTRSPVIDRPASYAEAVERTLNAVSAVKARLGGPAEQYMKTAMLQVLTPGKKLTFHFFPWGQTNEWGTIPAAAERDDALWKRLVPELGSSNILGVIAV
ncbi:hypothetical protein C8F01DRAFT_1377690 [Mycena amicta]|nr:hypothetical protein C8F01DRAFT_1377690 [Mycena amicta]